MELLRAQMSRILLYSFSETDEIDMQGRKIYEVHYKNTVDVTPDLDLDADGQITSFADDRDFGLGHFELVTHTCTLDTCSCQLLTSLGIVCVHVLLLREHFASCSRSMTAGKNLFDLIGVKWHMADDSLTRQRLATLHSFPLHAALTRPARPLTIPREERFSHLMEELRGLADLAARDMNSYQRLLQALPGIANSVSSSRDAASSERASTSSAIPSGGDVSSRAAHVEGMEANVHLLTSAGVENTSATLREEPLTMWISLRAS